jgi:prevent-host-death family protein
MREITLEQLTQDASALLDIAQKERIVVTRDGKPVAIVVGIEDKDEEDLRLEASPDFWRLIEERRREPTVPLAEIKEELLADEVAGG